MGIVTIEPPKIEAMSDEELLKQYKKVKKLADESMSYLSKCPKCGGEVRRILYIDIPDEHYHHQLIQDNCISCGYKKKIYEGNEDPFRPYVDEMDRKYKIVSVVFDGKGYTWGGFDFPIMLLETLMKGEIEKRGLQPSG